MKSIQHSGRLLKWLGIAVLLAILIAATIGEILLHRATPLLKGRVIETLSARFNSKVELDELQVSVLRGLDVSGSGLRIFPPEEVVAAGATQPLIAVERFSFRAALMGLFLKPMHVGTVHLNGLQISIPPREMRQQGNTQAKRHGKVKIEVGEFVCDDSRLVIGTAKRDKDPKTFELQHIVLRDVGPNGAWAYDATLVNAVPRGNIHAVGAFGPWKTDSPGDSTVTGHYIFDHADLNTIKGISGTLSSVGDFKGQLNRIEVEGTTEVPDFSLDTADRPMPLHTRFHSIVDGTTGDTYLQPVEAKLGESEFSSTGSVISVKGKGHTIDLDVDVPGARIQDFLQLAVRTKPVVMTGAIGTNVKLHIRTGKESISKKLELKGKFTLQRIHFTNPEVQDKVDMLSLRASGNPKEATPGAEDVNSRMKGELRLKDGILSVQNLVYTMPGAVVQLHGVYSMDGNTFDFSGKVRTRAKLSQMVASKWKSFMLKSVDPFFAKNGAGAEVPVKISGTQSAPKFGLGFGKK